MNMYSDSNELISIIVPVYNAEKYLECCLSSIRQQTYQNIEVILVDDGSTDSSNEICFRYQMMDTRFKLHTQPNGGRSSARNKGLSLASGEYVGFVDSDDWIDDDMFEVLHEAMTSSNVDIVQCSYYYHKGNEVEDMSLSENEQCLSRDQALELLFRDREIKNFLWNKLFRKGLFVGISFALGKNFEDVAVVYQLFAKANKIVCLPIAKYHYLVSDTSISHTAFSVKDKFDYLDALNAQYHFASSQGLWEKSSVVLAKKYLSIINLFLKYNAPLSDLALLAGYLKENINGWKLLRYSPYRAFRRFVFLYFRDIYRLFVKRVSL